MKLLLTRKELKMIITTKMQNTKQRLSSLEAEMRFASNYAFNTEMRDKQMRRRMPKNEYNQLVVLGNHILHNA